MNQNIKSGKKILVQDTKRQDRLAAILADDFFESENEIIDLIDGKHNEVNEEDENDNQLSDQKKEEPANYESDKKAENDKKAETFDKVAMKILVPKKQFSLTS